MIPSIQHGMHVPACQKTGPSIISRHSATILFRRTCWPSLQMPVSARKKSAASRAAHPAFTSSTSRMVSAPSAIGATPPQQGNSQQMRTTCARRWKAPTSSIFPVSRSPFSPRRTMSILSLRNCAAPRQRASPWSSTRTSARASGPTRTRCWRRLPTAHAPQRW
ncbi:hypothetical protein D3C87_1628270 [compost metagenome]